MWRATLHAHWTHVNGVRVHDIGGTGILWGNKHCYALCEKKGKQHILYTESYISMTKPQCLYAVISLEGGKCRRTVHETRPVTIGR